MALSACVSVARIEGEQVVNDKLAVRVTEAWNKIRDPWEADPYDTWTREGMPLDHLRFWGGVREGMIRVGWFGSKVPKPVQDEVLARQKDIAAGRLRPFAGPIADNRGRTVLAEGQALSDRQILEMDYLVAGVQGKAGQ